MAMGEPLTDEWIPNPDEVIVPEGRIHRRLSELIAAAAQRGLGAQWEVDSNLNWYPGDHGTAMAPDVMVLPTGVETIEDPIAGVSSYRQDKNGGPAPYCVVEIPRPSPAPISMPVAMAEGIPRGIGGLSRKNTPTGAATPMIAGGMKRRPGSLTPASASIQMPTPAPQAAAVA